jgi:predicted  nucleic acid-binding Zn-ribbon protein
LSKPREKNILPFATSPQGNMAFNGDVEEAAVFCLSELNREKGGGFIKKQDGESIIFISKLLYPFWIAPFKDFTILLDGLNVASSSITYPGLPDLSTMKIRLSTPMTWQVHTNFLTNNQNYFQNPNDEQKLTVEGLLKDGNFLSDFLNYANEAKQTDLQIMDAVVITPAFDDDGVTNMVQNVEKTRLKLSGELADLNESIRLLNQRNRESKDALNGEVQKVEDEFSGKIQKAKEELDAKVSELNAEYSAKVTDASNKHEEQMASLHEEVEKLTNEKETLNMEVEQVEAEIKTAAVNKDDASEQNWRQKRNALKDELAEIAPRLRDLEKRIREVQDSNKETMLQLKHDNDDKIKEAGKELAQIQAARAARIKVWTDKMVQIEELTSNIIETIDQAAKSREGTLLEFDKLGIKLKRNDFTLFYMPFYLTCYQVKSKKRYTFIEPSTVNSSQLSARLKSLGKAKITQIIQPRLRKITSILGSFINLMDENIVFNRDISEGCLKVNIVQPKERSNVTNGLTTLRQLGWLSQGEFESFNQAVDQAF